MARPAAGRRRRAILTDYPGGGAMSRTVAGRRAFAYPGRVVRAGAKKLSGADVVAQHPIGSVEHGERGPADHVAIGEIAAEQTVGTGVAPLDERGDDDVCIEGADDFHPYELEGDGSLGEALERANCRFGAEARVPGGTRLPFRAPEDGFSWCPFEGDFARDTSRGRTHEREPCEPQPFSADGGCLGPRLTLCALTRHRGHLGQGVS